LDNIRIFFGNNAVFKALHRKRYRHSSRIGPKGIFEMASYNLAINF
jgi:hypothetical protein